MTSGISLSPRVGSFSWSCSKWGCRPPPHRIVELPGCPGNPSNGVRETFSRAAVVIVEDVFVLIPLITRSWAASGLLVVAFRAPRGEECVSLIHIVDIYEVAVRVDPQKLGSRTHEAR